MTILPTQSLFAGINKPSDPANLTDLEKRHLPVITAPDTVKAGQLFEVTVEVGKLLEHPNDRGHFVSFIDLYVGPVYLARLSLTGVMLRPILKVCVQLDRDLGPLRAIEVCNIHGAWESMRNIKVM